MAPAHDTDTTFRVRSNSGGTVIEVCGNTVRVARRELVASTTVYELEPRETLRGLAELFRSVADDWRGWDGRRIWSSIEGEFKVAAQHDGLGTVELIVTLAQVVPTPTGTWSATASIYVDAGTLDEIARSARAFAEM